MAVIEPRPRADPAAAGPQRLEIVAQYGAQSGDPAAIRLLEGDNEAMLQALVVEAADIQLAYLDPPFFTQRVHHRTQRRRNRRSGRLERRRTEAFDDRWPDLESYLAALRQRLLLVRHLLSADGCMVVHIDPTTSHYVKVMCDEVFGRRAFASEIVWRYRRWPAKTRNFQRVHDTLLRYLRDPDAPPRFCQLYEPLAASTRATWGTHKQRAKTDGQGRRIRSTSTAEQSPGTPLGDVWEIGIIAPIAKERTGYPTQKPLALLNRIVQSCSHPGDLVLDPYVGSGTTLSAAAAAKRHAIGIDSSAEAVAVAIDRLEHAGVAFRHERLSPR